MKNVVLALLCFSVLGCTTIRMKYESVVTVDGQAKDYTYVNSYPVGGAHSSLCWITGIFAGGSCWFYLVMPTVQQKAMIIEEAQNKLADKLKGQQFAEQGPPRLSKVNYENGDEELLLNPRARAYTP